MIFTLRWRDAGRLLVGSAREELGGAIFDAGLVICRWGGEIARFGRWVGRYRP